MGIAVPAATTDSDAVAPSQEAPIELRGIMTSDGSTLFNIYDAMLRRSAWTRMDETENEFVVRSYDPARDLVSVDFQGRTFTLALRSAKGAASPQPIEGSVVLNPTPISDQQRRAFEHEAIHLRLVAQHAARRGKP
ncbi:MAG: hypothetical protein WC378_06500 [Opitutaceae bacterium]|jgi:hypothetical protein